MKTSKLMLGISAWIFLLLVASCDHHIPHPFKCRVSRMLWEGQWHDATYNSAGRLLKLEAPSSLIEFTYDGASLLKKAEIFTGGPDPDLTFEYTQGAYGIIETSLLFPDGFRRQYIFHYDSPFSIDYFEENEYNAGEDPTVPSFSIVHDLNYTGNNVKFIDGSVNGNLFVRLSSTAAYDKKDNPFRNLAAAVGNPLSFPACRLASFPGGDYDVSRLAIFSCNNPKKGKYEAPVGTDSPQLQAFQYTYSGKNVATARWTEEYFGNVETRDYAFEYDCRYLSATEE